MAKPKKLLALLAVLNFSIAVSAHFLQFPEDLSKVISNPTVKYVILDTDMGADDAWALQMILKAEKESNNVKVLAITTVDGITDVNNAIKNTYRILDGCNRTDVKYLLNARKVFAWSIYSFSI